MHTLIIRFPLMSTPRERVARNGGRYKSKEYQTYVAALSKEINSQLVSLREPIDYPYYVGLFNGYIPRYKNGSDPSDLDNILKGVLDTLVSCYKLRGDNRTNYVGLKKRCVIMPMDYNVIMIGSELEESKIDADITNYKNLARLRILGIEKTPG